MLNFLPKMITLQPPEITIKTDPALPPNTVLLVDPATGKILTTIRGGVIVMNPTALYGATFDDEFQRMQEAYEVNERVTQ